MPKELSAGMIVWNSKLRKFLVLESKSHWGFVKGKIKNDESEKETAVRELKEETGIGKFEFLDFKEKIKYYYKKEGEIVYKEVVFFLIESGIGKIKLSEEHKSFRWCGYGEACRLVKFKNTKEVLRKAKKVVS